ncbi:MAG: right-handed parallel beta-helix repeat-containing protein, partial [Gemmatimonadaceae bacterium]
MRTSARAAVVLAALIGGASPVHAQRSLVVAPGNGMGLHRVTDAIHAARAGDTIVIHAGTYREPTIVVDRPLVIVGVGGPTLDGGSSHEIMTVTADDVTVRGLRFAHVGTSYTEDRAALRVVGARRCTIEDNRLDDAFFGIYLAKATDCLVEGNVIRGLARAETSSGNGIHLWGAERVVVAGNDVRG